jgi:ABC-type Fe3+ transport system substrate-binding protein
MAVRDEIRQERAKLKGKGFKAHLEYFWDYYKIHTIVGIIVLITLITVVKDITGKKPYALYAMMLNCQGAGVQEALQTGYTEYAGIDTSKEDTVIDTFNTFAIANMDSSTIATGEKIMAFLAAGDLDILVADYSSFAHYAGQETFADLRTIFTEDELAAFGDDIYYVDRGYMDYLASDAYSQFITTGEYDKDNVYAVMAAEHDETGEVPPQAIEDMQEPIPVGIIMEDSTALKESGAYQSVKPVAGIVINSQRVDNAKAFIDYLYH